ncbi:hypothetical protein EDD18DRAFT_1037046, partial [Armillaria luteobubalina]
TIWDIVWGCLVTTFTCTWFAIHPNVPGRNITTKGTIPCFIQRARLMVIAILAPEIIVGWAATQFTVAWRIRHEKTDGSKLTLAHGFFLSMGGFYYTQMPPSVHKDLGVLVDVETLKSEPSLGKTLAAISVETIEDKSKGDSFSKIISILQISWFIMKSIHRTSHHLPLTLLEMSTLVLASLSIITYFLWWHKPLNVQ